MFLLALHAGVCGAVGAVEPPEPLVVSASRRLEPLWETPAALSVLGGEQLDGAGPRIQAAEALQRLPGVLAADRGN
ncbi:MAG: hypothetical protein ACO270_05400, partial [Burkholderiaceae bacterium]